MSLKTVIFFGLLAVALGSSQLPEEQVDSTVASKWADAEEVPIADDLLLLRKTRSPQGSFDGTFEQDQYGKRINLDYVHQVNKDFDWYAGASRDFSNNNNGGRVGFNWRF